VFASHGVLMWIADLDSWMRSAARALRAGGSLLLVEGHPVSLLVRSVDPPAFEGPYQGGGSVERELPDYARPDSATSHDRAIHYRWGLGDVVTAAVAAGIAVDALTEWMDDRSAHHRAARSFAVTMGASGCESPAPICRWCTRCVPRSAGEPARRRDTEGESARWRGVRVPPGMPSAASAGRREPREVRRYRNRRIRAGDGSARPRQCAAAVAHPAGTFLDEWRRRM
jgi:hypothetical protein